MVNSEAARIPRPRAWPSSDRLSERTGHDHGRQCTWPEHRGCGRSRRGTQVGGQDGVKPMGWLVSWGVGAVEPVMFGLGPVPAVRQALERAVGKSAISSASKSTRPLLPLLLPSCRTSAFPTTLSTSRETRSCTVHPIGRPVPSRRQDYFIRCSAMASSAGS